MNNHDGSKQTLQVPGHEERDIYADSLFQPIPVNLPSVIGWKELPLKESGEPLVEMGAFSPVNNDIFTSSVYHGEHGNSPYMMGTDRLQGSIITMFARAEVVSAVRHAQQLLPENHYLIVFDSYRSLEVQKALYDHYYDALKVKNPSWSEEDLATETQKYVSLPSTDETRPSPHNTGGSVDLAIYTLPEEVSARVADIDKKLEELNDPELDEAYELEMEKVGLIRRHADILNFGTPFDHGGPEAASNYYEVLEQQRPLTEEEVVARDNRRMLYNAMKEAGMEAYEDEWWHFNSPKSQMGAKSAGLDHAEYGGVELSQDNEAHEQMRKMHHAGLTVIQEALMIGQDPALARGGKMGVNDPRYQHLIDVNVRALQGAGDPRLTGIPKAAVIEPTKEEAA